MRLCDLRAVVGPAHAAAAPESLRQPIRHARHRIDEQLRKADEKKRPAFLRENRRVLRRQAEPLAVVLEVAGGGHAVQPLADVALVQHEAARDLFARSGASFREALEEAEAVTEDDHHRRREPRDVGDHLPEEAFETFHVDEVPEEASFLELLDVLNERLILEGDDPIAFDHDCREGICGSCGFMIDGVPHGPLPRTTVCQLHMRHYRDGDELWLEPWRATAFPVIRDLVVDRSAFDRIIQAGGYISARTGSAPDGNAIPIPKQNAELAMDAAECIGCGACVAACPNASAMLFTAAKVTHLGLLPQGQPERSRRVLAMVRQMDIEKFGGCTNYGECSAACPKEIPQETIAWMNREFLRATLTERPERGGDQAA